MAADIEKALGVKPALIAGGGGIFDVAVDGELVYSKFETGTYPDSATLIAGLS